MNRIKALSLAELSDGSMKTVRVGGKVLTIARIGQEIYAIDDACSHAECSLGSEGFVDELTVMCGCHGSRFDLVTGKVLSLPATEDVKSYRTEIEGGDVWIIL
ncbi:hypothetical protein A2Z33_02475 [Candidatus Gottesmanbacteria bacterium RBG_16_52_11]|uniref:Rieske domain-containing protein n=1 Tax=Candidatus Gottesmanbacteria bacterium RBG_16_52_11 TaxID=1798374 RepID=A0A1F5YMN6_9BACT|nr:MAG: hypothetical protein A2Z33_02475 [Candidatus Gottesmanbacteria bacterium RBG_16_52_11]